MLISDKSSFNLNTPFEPSMKAEPEVSEPEATANYNMSNALRSSSSFELLAPAREDVGAVAESAEILSSCSNAASKSKSDGEKDAGAGVDGRKNDGEGDADEEGSDCATEVVGNGDGDGGVGGGGESK